METWINVIVIAVLAAIAFGAGFYVYRAKKRGAKCIGCPYAKSNQNCSCHKNDGHS